MGNNTTKKRIIILDDNQKYSNYTDLYRNQQYTPTFYSNFEDFIEKENPKEIQNLVLRHHTIHTKFINNNGIKRNDTAQEMVVEESRMGERSQLKVQSVIKNDQNPFVDVCPLIRTQNKSLKDQVIQYVKKYLLELNIYLYVDDTTNIRLLQHEKPYIKLVSDRIQYIIDTLQVPSVQNDGINIKIQRLFQGLYRRITVKILDSTYSEDKNVVWPDQLKRDFKLLKDSKISYQYFTDVMSFQKSNISTACEYVICFSELLGEVIDSKKLCQEDYNIILRKRTEDQQMTGNPRKLKSLWAAEHDLNLIIEKMKNCSQISQQQAPQMAKNTIIIGNDRIYLQNFDEIQQKFRQKFKQKFKLQNMSVKFLKGKKLDDLLEQLRKQVYSFVVVFTQDEFLQNVKRFLQANNFHHRVQLTNVPAQLENYEDKINYMVSTVKYKIKFEVTPLHNIHCYKSNISEINFFSRKIGLKVHNIEGVDELIKKYEPPTYDEIIESQHLVCKVDDFIADIRPRLQKYKDTYFSKLKIIIMDTKKKIKKFISHDENFDNQIIFVDYSLSRIEDFIKYCKTSAVSIPFFRKNVLTVFEEKNKVFSVIKNSCELSLKSSVISCNQVLANYLSQQIKFSTLYNLQLITFLNCHRGVQKEIAYFEQQYIPNYIKLWYLGFDLFKKNGKEYCYLETIKELICLCFYKCKSYDLLKISQEDFQSFYINKIQQCKSFFDLQVACIYIISLPHNFNNVISHIFKSPRKSKLAIKIFAAYIIVLLTTFYQFGTQQIGEVQLVALIEQQKFQEKIQFLQPRDTIFSNDFIFCSDIQYTGEKSNKHSITFLFENVHFLDKSRIKNFVQIEKYSFYKEGAQYIIPPFTKFEVISTVKNQYGKYEIKLSNIRNSGDSFIQKLLIENNITEQLLWQALKDEINTMHNKNHQIDIIDSNSLYKKTQIINIVQSKQETINEFSKGSNYDNFFKEKNNNKYLSAYMHLQAKTKEIQNTQTQTGITNEKLNTQLVMLGNQYAYVHFKMSEYVAALNSLQDVENFLIDYRIAKDQGDWKLRTVKKFKKSVESTYENRKKLIVGYPKRKLWKVTLVQGPTEEPQFKLKTQSESWSIDFDPSLQNFPMTYEKNMKKTKLIQKIIKHETILPLTPQNQFGKTALIWINSSLFWYPFSYKSIKKNKEQTKMIAVNTPRQRIKRAMSIISESNSPQKSKDKMKELKDYNSVTPKQKEKPHRTSKVIEQEVAKVNAKPLLEPIQIKIKQKQSQPIKQAPQDRYRIPKTIQKIDWQVFYLDNEIQVVRKGKHFHTKGGVSKNLRKSKQFGPEEKGTIQNNFILPT